MHHYVDTFDFGAGSRYRFDKALRTFLGSFRLPGEAQCIDRLMEAFAGKLFRDLGVGKPFASADAAFILAFSTIMLNTDLHNPQIPDAKRMTKEQFLRNNKGINDGKDLPKEYLDSLYEDINRDQIKMDMDINDSDGASLDFTFSDSTLWNKMVRKSTADQAPAAFTPTVAARSGPSLQISNPNS
jgi:brefeldin A-resistance guanine nucleotide exchange factor 1